MKTILFSLLSILSLNALSAMRFPLTPLVREGINYSVRCVDTPSPFHIDRFEFIYELDLAEIYEDGPEDFAILQNAFLNNRVRLIYDISSNIYETQAVITRLSADTTLTHFGKIGVPTVMEKNHYTSDKTQFIPAFSINNPLYVTNKDVITFDSRGSGTIRCLLNTEVYGQGQVNFSINGVRLETF
jgi:hypothetical protein